MPGISRLRAVGLSGRTLLPEVSKYCVDSGLILDGNVIFRWKAYRSLWSLDEWCWRTAPRFQLPVLSIEIKISDFIIAERAVDSANSVTFNTGGLNTRDFN